MILNCKSCSFKRLSNNFLQIVKVGTNLAPSDFISCCPDILDLSHDLSAILGNPANTKKYKYKYKKSKPWSP